ncbi:undecaprenyl diphosphate synthase family protein [Methanoculleus sp. FWC-SCC1]|uniref:Undecaprenyl diphosphate synthase family protein n=1 Tax=Methanoculleus frigidifontis TaxID=2584085 RepID=A0ABT8M888_9EURY|nr:undecaprenyl diphosphate synthase family protein [Methanoculleus sp. FWC-SCC1]MDN7024142.1 undecaprenyl diphosphate synthase family protein [Methanoculleus sp. FWC-SCC1]
MIYWLYEKYLRRNLSTLPGSICFMITEQDHIEAPGNLSRITEWCRELGIGHVTFHISTDDPDRLARYIPEIRTLGEIARLTLRYRETKEVLGSGIDVTVAIGESGRQEITACIRKMAERGVDPEEVDEARIESFLTFPYEPDLVIKTGGDYLTDFLIWQSVYSELFFLDVNWPAFRKVDFLRALRDYQARARRFGT